MEPGYYAISNSDLAQPKQYGELIQPPWLSNPKEQGPPKCYLDDERDVVQWILAPFSEDERRQFTKLSSGKRHLKTTYQSLDTSIMDLADDISYSIHDLEDAIELRLITKDDWLEHFTNKSYRKPQRTAIRI